VDLPLEAMSDDDADADGRPDEVDDQGARAFLTFCVDALEYAVPVSRVTEIVRLPQRYAIPDVPSYVRGVINLRGKVVPLIDARARFGLLDAAYTNRTVVVVLDLGETLTGLVVDAVSAVVTIEPATVAPFQDDDRGPHGAFICGIAKRDEGLSLMLDIARFAVQQTPDHTPDTHSGTEH
jgi:purine-binding chemotaxis protein CheW